MILPQKHISLSESMYGFGAMVIGLIEGNMTVDELWEKYKRISESGNSSRHGFDSFILVLDYLFLIGAIDLDDSGCIKFEVH